MYTVYLQKCISDLDFVNPLGKSLLIKRTTNQLGRQWFICVCWCVFSNVCFSVLNCFYTIIIL